MPNRSWPPRQRDGLEASKEILRRTYGGIPFAIIGALIFGIVGAIVGAIIGDVSVHAFRGMIGGSLGGFVAGFIEDIWKRFSCQRCGHEWMPLIANKKPQVCDKCDSPFWDIPRNGDVPEIGKDAGVLATPKRGRGIFCAIGIHSRTWEYAELLVEGAASCRQVGECQRCGARSTRYRHPWKELGRTLRPDDVCPRCGIHRNTRI